LAAGGNGSQAFESAEKNRRKAMAGIGLRKLGLTTFVI